MMPKYRDIVKGKNGKLGLSTSDGQITGIDYTFKKKSIINIKPTIE